MSAAILAYTLATAFTAPQLTRVGRMSARVQMSDAPTQVAQIQFIEGIDEPVVPDIKLTRSPDGSTGTATFLFDQPSFLESSVEPQGEITGMFMKDSEGVMKTTDVNAKFVNGKPRTVEAVYIMRSTPEFDRVMRFLERYAESHGLGFNKA
eukprot:CAMPEP_0185191864 /NCGR_PEP_ID=MMETSP1140-20130426/17445_1 /TAXON_ID=298111 /ORGANISM="Pavlova sp., Strain CCMP459" /LENGTH=150 /DNA_ID=CAMNT_0027758589 /DNA_START=25 /DNA_END=477 /DNA_ORIENTATION=+